MINTEPTAAISSAMASEVLAVIDNGASLGNGTVQLAKDALDSLLPSTGATSTLGVVTTGGGASTVVPV